MGYYCDYDGDGDFGFQNSRWPKAKKEYKCCECHQKISIGEKYCRTTLCWDKSITTYHQHLHCEEACRYLRDFVLDGCVPFGDLMDSLEFMKNDELDFHHPRDRANFRSLMARVVWFKKKQRPLKIFRVYRPENSSLIIDRQKGFA